MFAPARTFVNIPQVACLRLSTDDKDKLAEAIIAALDEADTDLVVLTNYINILDAPIYDSRLKNSQAMCSLRYFLSHRRKPRQFPAFFLR